jgi:hypothetical protein
MRKNKLLALWGALFILCAALGFVPGPTGWGRGLLVLLSVGFFVPPVLLLRCADRQTALLVRNLAGASLGLTLLLLIGNFLSVLGSEGLGNFLYAMLVIVSAPMVCGQIWVLSLFLWACLLMVSIKKLRKR